MDVKRSMTARSLEKNATIEKPATDAAEAPATSGTATAAGTHN
jgi:hypothetical protein